MASAGWCSILHDGTLAAVSSHPALCFNLFCPQSGETKKRSPPGKEWKSDDGKMQRVDPSQVCVRVLVVVKCAAGPQRRDAAAANSKSTGLVPRTEDG